MKKLLVLILVLGSLLSFASAERCKLKKTDFMQGRILSILEKKFNVVNDDEDYDFVIKGETFGDGGKNVPTNNLPVWSNGGFSASNLYAKARLLGKNGEIIVETNGRSSDAFGDYKTRAIKKAIKLMPNCLEGDLE